MNAALLDLKPETRGDAERRGTERGGRRRGRRGGQKRKRIAADEFPHEAARQWAASPVLEEPRTGWWRMIDYGELT